MRGPSRSNILSPVFRLWARHPRWSLAAKGAVATALSWYIGLLAPAPFSEYPYYAPLGAMIAMSNTTVRSARESAQAIGAVLVGAVIARGVDSVVSSSVLSVALVVVIALLCAGWRVFGEMGSWAVTSALFVLILGGAEQLEYVGVFAGLIVVGAAIGVAINLLLPPLLLTPSDIALDRLRDVLSDQTAVLADRLEQHGPLEAEEWQRRRRELAPVVDHARGAVSRTGEAMRANRRARRYGDWARVQELRSTALTVSGDVVGDALRLLAQWEDEDLEHVALGPHLRPYLVDAVRTYADALRSDEGAGPSGEAAARCEDAVSALADAVRADARSSDDDYFVAGALVVILRRGVDALAGPDAGRSRR